MRHIVLALCTLSLACSTIPRSAITEGPTVPGHALVVSASAPASRVGAQVMQQGGNAVDGAVATAFALAVTFPEAGNLGGGGFMLIHFPDDRQPVCVDYRETAPAAVNANTFAGTQDRTAARLAGVPGTVRGLALAHQSYGKLPWRDLIQPAIALARDGYVLDADKAATLNRVLAANPGNAELHRVYGRPDAAPWHEGDHIVQPDLAQTLQLIADRGPDAFYTGPIADRIVAEIRRDGGLMTQSDLAGYNAKIRQPLITRYDAGQNARNVRVILPPPPSSGGVAIIEMLHTLDRLCLNDNIGRPYQSTTLHVLTEVQRRAYADRAKYLGDPDFVPVDAIVQRLTGWDHADQLRQSIDMNKATASDALPDAPKLSPPQTAAPVADTDIFVRGSTTHFSVIDPNGMAVANTYTLEQSFGGKIVVAGAGFLLNNELGDFNPQPGVTTRAGQIGTDANLPAPGKRPLSSMTPTIVTDATGKVLLITGSPGGRTIINTVLRILVNRFDYHMSPRQCIDAPRHHHQWFPDQIQVEPALAGEHAAELDRLRQFGHAIDPTPHRQGDAHSIFLDDDGQSYLGVADQRRAGAAAGY